MKRIIFLENIIIAARCFSNWFENQFVNLIPLHSFRLFYYKNISGIHLGNNTSISLYTEIREPKKIILGDNCAINQHCYLDGRGKLKIGNNVNIGRYVSIYTAGHDYNNPDFTLIHKPVVIEDHVWIASNVTVLPGVTIAEGAVVAAGSVVTRDVKRFSVVGGNPAHPIKKRNEKINYKTKFFRPFY